MSEIELKPCKRWWDSPNRSETTAKLLRSYCETTAKLLRKVVDE